MNANIHQGQTILRMGEDQNNAELVVILLHGRGATSESMLPLAETLSLQKTNFMIPQAGLNRWYPNSAFAPLESNEPDLTSALELIDSLVSKAKQEGFSENQIAIGGFSQGACLALEVVARNPRNYAGLFAFTGALIGPPDQPQDFSGSLEKVPVFIGGSNDDPWVSHELRVRTAGVFEKLGAQVDLLTYPGTSHTITQDEIDAVRKMLL